MKTVAQGDRTFVQEHKVHKEKNHKQDPMSLQCSSEPLHYLYSCAWEMTVLGLTRSFPAQASPPLRGLTIAPAVTQTPPAPRLPVVPVHRLCITRTRCPDPTCSDLGQMPLCGLGWSVACRLTFRLSIIERNLKYVIALTGCYFLKL